MVVAWRPGFMMVPVEHDIQTGGGRFRMVRSGMVRGYMGGDEQRGHPWSVERKHQDASDVRLARAPVHRPIIANPLFRLVRVAPSTSGRAQPRSPRAPPPP